MDLKRKAWDECMYKMLSKMKIVRQRYLYKLYEVSGSRDSPIWTRKDVTLDCQ